MRDGCAEIFRDGLAHVGQRLAYAKADAGAYGRVGQNRHILT